MILRKAAEPVPKAPHFMDLRGQTFGELKVLRIVSFQPTKYLCRCSCRKKTTVQAYNLTSGHSKTCGHTRYFPKQPEPTYWQAHCKLRREFGPARNYLCIVCGEQATDWAYLGGAPDERVGMVRSGKVLRPMPFSMDSSYYVAMNRSCHVKFDRGLI